MKGQTTRLAPRAGFTVLEVLVAALALGIGLVGIMGMQASSGVASRTSYNNRVATQLADTIYERIKRDALEWTSTSTPQPGTWLEQAFVNRVDLVDSPPSGESAEIASWTQFRGVVDPGTGAEIAMLNDLGIPGYRGSNGILSGGSLDPSAPGFVPSSSAGPAAAGLSAQRTRGQRFCAEYRMNDVVADEMVQLAVRVHWPRNVDGEARLSGSCEALSDAGWSRDERARELRTVTVTGTFRKNDLNANAEPPPSS